MLNVYIFFNYVYLFIYKNELCLLFLVLFEMKIEKYNII